MSGQLERTCSFFSSFWGFLHWQATSSLAKELSRRRILRSYGRSFLQDSRLSLCILWVICSHLPFLPHGQGELMGEFCAWERHCPRNSPRANEKEQRWQLKRHPQRMMNYSLKYYTSVKKINVPANSERAKSLGHIIQLKSIYAIHYHFCF